MACQRVVTAPQFRSLSCCLYSALGRTEMRRRLNALLRRRMLKGVLQVLPVCALYSRRSLGGLCDDCTGNTSGKWSASCSNPECRWEFSAARPLGQAHLVGLVGLAALVGPVGLEGQGPASRQGLGWALALA